MSYDVDVRGEEGLQRLARALHAAAGDVQERVRDAAEAKVRDLLPQRLSAAARDRLPRAGGLAEEVARTRWSIDAAADRIRIESDGSPYDLLAINAGQISHPVYGRSDTAWVSQDLRPGWFTDTADQAEGAITEAAEDAIADLARDVERRT